LRLLERIKNPEFIDQVGVRPLACVDSQGKKNQTQAKACGYLKNFYDFFSPIRSVFHTEKMRKKDL
jgi:hypothetical protein